MTTTALELKFLNFARSLGAEIIDDIPMTEEQNRAKKADIFFEDRTVICEMKSLLKDTSAKIEPMLAPYRDTAEFPHFYGRWQMSEILSRLPEGNSLWKELYEAISSAIPELIRSANRQIRETKRAFSLFSSGGLLLVLNDAVEVLDPNLIGHRVASTLQKRNPDGSLQFPEIAGAWIISEKHFASVKDKVVGLPAIDVRNPSVRHVAVDAFLDRVHAEWARYIGLPLVQVDASSYDSVTFEPIRPRTGAQVTLTERMKQEYARNPYLRDLKEAELLEYGGRLADELSLVMERDDNPGVARLRGTCRFGDLICELNERHIDLRQLSGRELKPSKYLNSPAGLELTSLLADIWDEQVDSLI